MLLRWIHSDTTWRISKGQWKKKKAPKQGTFLLLKRDLHLAVQKLRSCGLCFCWSALYNLLVWIFASIFQKNFCYFSWKIYSCKSSGVSILSNKNLKWKSVKEEKNKRLLFWKNLKNKGSSFFRKFRPCEREKRLLILWIMVESMRKERSWLVWSTPTSSE